MKEMATHSRILAWKIPQREEPGGLSTWDHKESDTTKQITHTLTYASNKTGSIFITSEFLKILALDIKKSNTN